MIDPSFDTDGMRELTNTLLTPYPTVENLEQKVAELEAALAQKTTDHAFVRDQLSKYVNQVSSFEGALKNNEWDFDFETLSDLAGYFDIELNRDYDVTITVRWSGTVTAPMNFDIDDLENYLDIRIDTDYRTSDAIVDLYQDDFEFDYTEA